MSNKICALNKNCLYFTNKFIHLGAAYSRTQRQDGSGYNIKLKKSEIASICEDNVNVLPGISIYSVFEDVLRRE